MMSRPKSRTKSPVRAASRPRFFSRLSKHLNDILGMRYVEDMTVESVLAWLEEQSCPIKRRSFQEFMTRVLRLMPLSQARLLKVDADLLRAVRVRY